MSIINNYNMQMILDGSNKEMIKEILRDRSRLTHFPALFNDIKDNHV